MFSLHLHMNPSSPEEPTPSGKPILTRIDRFWKWIQTTSFRDIWWAFLDAWEKHRTLRFTSYALLSLIFVGAVIGWGFYPQWNKQNATRITQQWLEVNKLQHATLTAQQAIEQSPDSPETWQLAAEVARRRNDKQRALYHSGMAARLAPENTQLVLQWASDALLSNQTEIAQSALDLLPEEVLETTAWGQRIAGEIARRNHNYATAKIHFERAIAIDGPLPVNQVPLATLLLNSDEQTERSQVRKLLRRWTEDPDWGAPVMRTLLADAIKRDDSAAMARWADLLRAHPECTLTDIANCLTALSVADEARFQQVITQMKARHAATPTDAAQLIGWLNRLRRSDEAIAWVKTLPDDLISSLPLPPIIAETFRLNDQWDALQSWTSSGDWGDNLDPLRTAYALLAALESNQATRAEIEWLNLQRKTNSNGGRALFVANAIYAWGLKKQAVKLLWSASEQPGHGYEALGTLVRHYQNSRDAEGQFRVFQQLHNLRSSDPDIANNFAFFAGLTGNSIRRADEIAQDNFQRFPNNDNYRATYAFLLIKSGKHSQARAVIQSILRKWREVPSIAFIQGLLLIHDGNKTAAREVFYTINPDTLTLQEVEMVESLLK